MARERDLFANFERMRREMDELFGEALDRALTPRRRGGFSPPVDVFYEREPPRAVAVIELGGIDPSEVEVEVRGSEVVISGVRRPPTAAEGRVYQQLEIAHGPFRRVVQVQAEVDAEATRASYEHGMLRVELPLRMRSGRQVPISPADDEDAA